MDGGNILIFYGLDMKRLETAPRGGPSTIVLAGLLGPERARPMASPHLHGNPHGVVDWAPGPALPHGLHP